MNKEIVTFGVVAALMAAFYFLGGLNPDQARVEIRRATLPMRRLSYEKPNYAPVHRIEEVAQGRNPDSIRRFVDPRERDSFARPSIGRRLPLPQLGAPPFGAEELELIRPPLEPGAAWGLLGEFRDRLEPFDDRILAEAEDAFEEAEEKAAEEAAAAAEEESEEDVVVIDEETPEPPQDEGATWSPPPISGQAFDTLSQVVTREWPGRYLDPARMEWLETAIERLVELGGARVDGLLWKARLLDEQLRWDAAWTWYAEKLVGTDGQGPHARDPRVCLEYSQFLRDVGLGAEADRWAQSALSGLESASFRRSEVDRVWVAATLDLIASGDLRFAGVEHVAWRTRPKDAIALETLTALAAAAYAVGDLEAMGTALSAGRARIEPPGETPGEATGSSPAAAGATGGAASGESVPGESPDPLFTRLEITWRLLDLLRRTPLRPTTKAPELEALLAEIVTLRSTARELLASGALGDRGLALPAAIFAHWLQVRSHLERRMDAEAGGRGTTAERRTEIGKRRQALRKTLEAMLIEEYVPLRRVALERSLRSPQAYRALAWMRLAGGDEQGAALELESGLAIVPGEPYMRYLSAVLALRAGEFERGRAVLAALLREYPDLLDAVHLAGFAAWMSGDRDAAAPLLDRVITRDERFQAAWFLSGIVEWERGQNQVADDRLRRSVQLDPQDQRARIALELTAYERRKLSRSLTPVLERLEAIRAKLEDIDRRHPLLAYVRDLYLKIDRARDAREFLDALDRYDKLALFEWEEPAEARGVHAQLGRVDAELAEPNEFGAQPRGGCLHFTGTFAEKGRTSFWTAKLIRAPANFLLLEVDATVGEGNEARVGIAVGRMQIGAEGRGPELDNASFAVGIAHGIDQATRERTTYFLNDPDHDGWDRDPETYDQPLKWPSGTPVRLRIETHHYRGTTGAVAEVRMRVGEQVVHPSREWLQARKFMEKSGGSQGLTLMVFAEGDEGQRVDFRIDNIRIHYRVQ